MTGRSAPFVLALPAAVAVLEEALEPVLAGALPVVVGDACGGGNEILV